MKKLICLIIITVSLLSLSSCELIGEVIGNTIELKKSLRESASSTKVTVTESSTTTTFRFNGFEGKYTVELGSFSEGSIYCTAYIAQNEIVVSHGCGALSGPYELLTANTGVVSENSGYISAGTIHVVFEASAPASGEITITIVESK